MPNQKPRFSRFDRLTDIVYVQVVEGTDVLLDHSDAFLLLEGIDYLRSRIEALRKRGKQAADRRHNTKKGVMRRAAIAQDLRRRETELRLAEQIARDVATEHNIAFQTLRGTRRQKRVMTARHQAILAIFAECTLLSTEDIARVMGCDRTTVGYALGRVKNRVPPHLRELQEAA